jgi:hypothetical protein
MRGPDGADRGDGCAWNRWGFRARSPRRGPPFDVQQKNRRGAPGRANPLKGNDMFMILGSSKDTLARGVYRRLIQESRTPLFLSEEEALLAPIAIEHRDRRMTARLQVQGVTVDLCQLHGVLVRLPRKWWPSGEFTLKDQMFVYHETTATWFHLLSLLPGNVINRFGLGWWVQDSVYPSSLGLSLSAALSIPRARSRVPAVPAGRLLPEPPPDEEGCGSVYVAGRKLLAGRGGSDLVGMLEARSAALARWQRETGVFICRLDFDLQPKPALRHVEAFPLLESEPGPLADDVTDAVSEVIQ